MRPGDSGSASPDRGEPVPASRWREEETLTLLNHDLRNALASISSAVHILEHEGYVSDVAEQAGRTIERQAESLLLLADQLSELAGVPKDRRRENGRTAAPVRDQVEETAPLRILVVDDNRDAADSTGMLLLLWGHKSRVAYDGPSALTAAREFRPDVCLLDLGMPGMSGYQLAERLRQEPDLAGAVLVALTGFDREGDRESVQAAGFDDHLVKPVEMSGLRDILVRKGRSG
jgi:CheY-like chemotaxis protein